MTVLLGTIFILLETALATDCVKTSKLFSHLIKRYLIFSIYEYWNLFYSYVGTTILDAILILGTAA